MRKRLVPLMCTVLLLTPVAACGDDESGLPPTSAATTTATTTIPSTSTSVPVPTTFAPAACTATTDWTTSDRYVEWSHMGSPLYLFDAGRHDCFDRLVLRLNGPEPAGAFVGYVDGEVGFPGTGDPIVTAGDAALNVHVLAPVAGGFYDRTGHMPGSQPFGAIGSSIYPVDNPKGLRVVREVRFGGDYEAETTFAVGVDTRRAFMVTTFVDENQIRRLVIDIAS